MPADLDAINEGTAEKGACGKLQPTGAALFQRNIPPIKGGAAPALYARLRDVKGRRHGDGLF